MPGSNPRGRSGPFGPAHRVGLVFNSPAIAWAPPLAVSGVTKDSGGAILGSCAVRLFRTSDNVLMATQVSDAGTGAYLFTDLSAGASFYVVAYKAGSPDVAGTTLNTLQLA